MNIRNSSCVFVFTLSASLALSGSVPLLIVFRHFGSIGESAAPVHNPTHQYSFQCFVQKPFFQESGTSHGKDQASYSRHEWQENGSVFLENEHRFFVSKNLDFFP